MESKPDENFLSLECKDISLYPPPSSLFIRSQLWLSRPGNIPFESRETYPLPHALKVVWENYLTHLCHLRATVIEISLRIAIFTDKNLQTRSPCLSLPDFDSISKTIFQTYFWNLDVRSYRITGLHSQKAYTHSGTSCPQCVYQNWWCIYSFCQILLLSAHECMHLYCN